MRVAARSESERIEAEIELLPKLCAEQLDERWRELFGTARPQRLYGPLLIGVLAYRLQEKAFGGIKPVGQAIRKLPRSKRLYTKRSLVGPDAISSGVFVEDERTPLFSVVARRAERHGTGEMR
jgi:hypothetical protein